jgi:hypothetical protein
MDCWISTTASRTNAAAIDQNRLTVDRHRSQIASVTRSTVPDMVTPTTGYPKCIKSDMLNVSQERYART